MKTFAALLAVALCIQALGVDGFDIDWSKIRPRYPSFGKKRTHTAPKVPQLERPMRMGTRDMRAEGCGIPNRPANGRIVGGWESGVNEYPWQVAVFIDDLYFCGGSLISDRHVLTAAHCAEDAQFFNLMLGAHNVRLPASDEPQRVEVTATQYDIHPGWDSFNIRNDIAIITLPEPITFNDVISPICLPDASFVDPVAGDVLELSGWGRPSDAVSSISPVLRKTNVTTITNEACNAVYGIIFDSNICIGTTDGHGSCNGDSGGPLSVVGADDRFTEVGIVSFGSSAGCEAGYPAGFTRVTYFNQWISAITGIKV